jgi:hypothetical protein
MTYYFFLNDFDIFASTFAFRSNVDELLGPGVKFHQPGPSSLSTLGLKANDNAKNVEVIQADNKASKIPKDLSKQDFGFKVFETMPIWEDYDRFRV